MNVEPDEAIEEEADDTKEIQIEEALKLYQNALKLHSQGPQFYPQAAEAYDALLNSDIFKYDESISDYKRSSVQAAESEPVEPEEDIATTEALGELDVNDSTSSTLLQTIYLSYKNHGQYLLDSLENSLQQARQSPDAVSLPPSKVNTSASAALSSFADALERDDTDLNLWRQSARLGGALQSFRLARYCLESVLADDENRLESRAEQLGIEETFAEERLREALRSLHDTLSVSQVPVKTPKKALLKFLRQQTDPYPYLPTLPSDVQDIALSRSPSTPISTSRTITPTARTWEAVGKAILEAFTDEQADVIDLSHSASISIALPSITTEVAITDAEEQRGPNTTEPQDDALQSIEQGDVQMADNDDHGTGAESTNTPQHQEPDTARHSADNRSSGDQAERQLIDSLEGQSKQQPETAGQQDTEVTEELEPGMSGTNGRKRSSASAGNDEAEGVRTKSKRIRARESNADAVLQPDEIAFDHSRYYENRLAPFTYADEWMFGTVDSLLSKVGVEDLGPIEDLKRQVAWTSDRRDSADTKPDGEIAATTLYGDLRNTVMNWDNKKSQAIHQGDSLSRLHDIRGMGTSGLTAFLEHSKRSTRRSGLGEVFLEGEELSAFINVVDDGRFDMHEIAFGWLRCLLAPEYGKYSAGVDLPDDASWPEPKSAYTSFQWPEMLKETVVQLLQQEDEYVYSRLSEQVANLDSRILHATESQVDYEPEDVSALEMTQSIYELHIDMYAEISNPSSDVDQGPKLLQRDRLSRWSVLARTALGHFIDCGPQVQNNITMRHLWASTFHMNLTEDAHREHILLCLHDLKRILHCLGNPNITLLNNSTMPELSVGVIDQEVSKLQTMDFFLKIFSADSKDPVDLIETVEPILEPSSIEFEESGQSDGLEQNCPTSRFHEMRSFLDRGDATLRLFLWRRLQDAYSAIDYPPKVVSCHLRSIETIMRELQSASYLEESPEHRQVALIKWIKSLDGILIKLVNLALQEPQRAYESLDMAHLQSSMSAVTKLLKLLHTSALYEDSVRVGQTLAPELRVLLSKSLEIFKDKLREMQVRCWILQYTLLKEAMAQNPELYDTPAEDCVHFLRSVHHALGIRSMCKHVRKRFLRLMKSELLSLPNYEDYEFDIYQILYDLHDVKFYPFDRVADHGCSSEALDRATALTMIDFVLRQAKRYNIKDLSKSELKSTIEKMQKVIGASKPSLQLSHNKRNLSAYLKKPINPTNLLRAVRGVGDLSMVNVPTETAEIAHKGWYFLNGYAVLTKFRSQKRLAPVDGKELEDAILYFRQDLEHNTGRWESWYRLAQTYDSKLEEDITWSAEKINDKEKRTELAVSQRYAIHCYTMAVATAIRTAEPTAETRATMSDLFSDFAIRMYASSREPLSMEAFSLADFDRYYSNVESQQMYTAQPFKETKLYFAWNFARYLLKRAIIDKPKNWM